MIHARRVRCPHCAAFQTIEQAPDVSTHRCTSCKQSFSCPVAEPVAAAPLAPAPADAVSVLPARPLPLDVPNIALPEPAPVVRLRRRRKRRRTDDVAAGIDWRAGIGFWAPPACTVVAWVVLVVLGVAFWPASLFGVLLGFGLVVLVGGLLWGALRAAEDGQRAWSWWGGFVGQLFINALTDITHYLPPLLLCGLGALLCLLASPLHHVVNHEDDSLPAPRTTFVARGNGRPRGAPPVKQAAVVPPEVQKLLQPGPGIYLAQLQEFDVKPGPWPFTKNGTAGDGQRIRLQGAASPHGLGMHPPAHPDEASVKFRLDKRFAQLRTVVAINDSSNFTWTPAVFSVWGDDVKLWESAAIARDHAPWQECVVDVTGVDVLELRVRCMGQNTGVHAVWFEPRLLKKGEPP
jgi:hypothetical protein